VAHRWFCGVPGPEKGIGYFFEAVGAVVAVGGWIVGLML